MSLPRVLMHRACCRVRVMCEVKQERQPVVRWVWEQRAH